MSPQNAPLTPYQQELYNVIEQLKAAGWNAATPAQIAENMGRTVTPSLRKRLKQAAADGHLYEYTFYTERQGLAKAYWLRNQLPLPAMPAMPF